MNATKIANAILAADMSRDDLNAVIRAINLKNRQIQANAKAAFRAGELVEWISSRTGLTMKGTVIKVMVKNIKVRTDGGTLWTVSPTLLRKAS